METLETLAERIDTLAAFTETQFDEVAEALVEQRQYTEFAFETLRTDLNAGFVDVRTDVSVVRADLAETKTELKGDIRGLQADMVGVKVELSALTIGFGILDQKVGVLDRKLDQVLEHVTVRPPRRKRRS